MKEKINSPKRPQSLGEEIGNSITHGVGSVAQWYNISTIN